MYFIFKMEEFMSLHKSHNKVISGVCAGIAETLGFNAGTVRIIYFILTVFTAFSGVLIYIVLAFLLNEEDETYSSDKNRKKPGYCENCGTKLKPGTTFCPNCGNMVNFD